VASCHQTLDIKVKEKDEKGTVLKEFYCIVDTLLEFFVGKRGKILVEKRKEKYCKTLFSMNTQISLPNTVHPFIF